jgi:hypothetical protein
VLVYFFRTQHQHAAYITHGADALCFLFSRGARHFPEFSNIGSLGDLCMMHQAESHLGHDASAVPAAVKRHRAHSGFHAENHMHFQQYSFLYQKMTLRSWRVAMSNM